LPAGRPVLLVHRAGLEFPVAFFACLYAGAIPVAVHPPHRGLSRRYLDSFAAIAEDVRPAAVVGTARTLDQLPPEARALPVLRGASWVAQLEGQDAETAAAADIEPRPTTAGPDDLAYLQYTSGSTARPRGVMINHGPLMEQLEYYRLRGGPSWHQAVLVGWLPHQHDYGLVGFVLSALYMGISYIFFSPSTFLRDPARWLAAISGEGGTYSGAPAFAYDLCARTVEPAAISGLDLSAWTIASTGGEPISASTLERFAARLAPYGFDRAAFLPSYGLAEAVLCVSARQGVKTCRGRVSVGSTLAGQRAIVVDPGTRQLCAEGELGEVWVAGRSLAAGYWRRPQETAEVFGALPADADGGPYLRTGDLGFIDGGELYVADRLKDAIVVRGVNYHPADLERTVQTLDPALIPGGGAAFQVEQDGEERLVVVQEALDAPGSDRLALLTRIRSAVAEDQGVQVHAVALIAAGSIARTPSGKVRRHEVRDAWLAGSLTTTAERKFGAPDSVQRELARL
ncbi:MAG: fatty acyl-AMP ligase, partial [Streptosporangiaceae bacterium]